MDNLLTLAFEAHNAEKNHHRRYELAIGKDLLDDWTLAVRFGRLGVGGQRQQFGSRLPEDIRAILGERLRRRLSAPKRIGCPYRLVGLTAAPGFDPAAWLHGDLMARFFLGV